MVDWLIRWLIGWLVAWEIAWEFGCAVARAVRCARAVHRQSYLAGPLGPPDLAGQSSSRRAETKASGGTSTRPMFFIFFFPSFCFSNNLRLRVMSPP